MKSPFKNDPFAIVWQAFNELYPDKECKCYIAPKTGCDSMCGLTIFNEETTVLINAELPVEYAVEILAHELAHVAAGVGHDHDEAWEKAFEDIYDKYHEILGGLNT